MGQASMVFYRIRKIGGKYYLYKEYYDDRLKKKRSVCLGPCEVIEQLVLTEKAKKGRVRLTSSLLSKDSAMVRRPGFEPGISGVAGRRPRPG